MYDRPPKSPRAADTKSRDTPRPASRSAGGNIPHDLRLRMERSFDADFSNVKVHASSPRPLAMGAVATTEAEEIHIAPGAYDTRSSRGAKLLGHELAHVVQQRQGRVRPMRHEGGAVINDDVSLEREADSMAAHVASGSAPAMSGQGVAHGETTGAAGAGVIQCTKDFETYFPNMLVIPKSKEPCIIINMADGVHATVFLDQKLKGDASQLVNDVSTRNNATVARVQALSKERLTFSQFHITFEGSGDTKSAHFFYNDEGEFLSSGRDASRRSEADNYASAFVGTYLRTQEVSHSRSEDEDKVGKEEKVSASMTSLPSSSSSSSSFVPTPSSSSSSTLSSFVPAPSSSSSSSSSSFVPTPSSSSSSTSTSSVPASLQMVPSSVLRARRLKAEKEKKKRPEPYPK